MRPKITANLDQAKWAGLDRPQTYWPSSISFTAATVVGTNYCSLPQRGREDKPAGTFRGCSFLLWEYVVLTKAIFKPFLMSFYTELKEIVKLSYFTDTSEHSGVITVCFEVHSLTLPARRANIAAQPVLCLTFTPPSQRQLLFQIWSPAHDRPPMTRTCSDTPPVHDPSHPLPYTGASWPPVTHCVLSVVSAVLQQLVGEEQEISKRHKDGETAREGTRGRDRGRERTHHWCAGQSPCLCFPYDMVQVAWRQIP